MGILLFQYDAGDQCGAANKGYSFDYLQHYAAWDGAEDVYTLCLSVLDEVEEVLESILCLAEET